MAIVNKRNAVLGWLTWNVGKRVAKKKAKGAVPSGGKPRPKILASTAGALAAAGGALLFWRKRKRSGGATT
jgi:LPXTG-motif cell wall-anchored protein